MCLLRSVWVRNISSFKYMKERMNELNGERERHLWSFVHVITNASFCSSSSLSSLSHSLLTFLSLSLSTVVRPFHCTEICTEIPEVVDAFHDSLEMTRGTRVATQIPITMEIEMAIQETVEEKEKRAENERNHPLAAGVSASVTWMMSEREAQLFLPLPLSLALSSFCSFIVAPLTHCLSDEWWVICSQKKEEDTLHAEREREGETEVTTMMKYQCGNNMQQMIIWSNGKEWLLDTLK